MNDVVPPAFAERLIKAQAATKLARNFSAALTRPSYAARERVKAKGEGRKDKKF
jgi:hypothetical protein